MASSLPAKVILPFNGRHERDNTLFPKPPSSIQFHTQKSHFLRLNIHNHNQSSLRSSSFKTLISRKDQNLMSSTLLKLERQQDEEETKQEQDEIEKSLPRRWREILGQDNWADLLDPIDPLLRSELIRYGEMVQACYDSFDYDPYSKHCGSCRYNRQKFFAAIGITNCGYTVSRYLYAGINYRFPNFGKRSVSASKLWSPGANWIGYVAVSNDETSKSLGRRDIVIAWRGTVTRLEWLADLMAFATHLRGKIPCPDPLVKVESGFLDLYTDRDETCRFCKYSAKEQFLTEIRRILQMYPNEEISITIMGHSLGAALAILSAYDLVENGMNVKGDGRKVPVCVFSFAGPRVGNVHLKRRAEKLGVKVLRVVNVHDTVPTVPGVFINEKSPRWMIDWFPWSYAHLGQELELDHKKSPYLKESLDISNYHNLEAHLHLLDGYQGKKQEKFVLASGRDPALVNKSADFLKEELMVPPAWWQYENKGLILNEEGKWVQPDKPVVHIDDQPHPHDIDHHIEQLGLRLTKQNSAPKK